MDIRTRIAPSPTGFLHIGTARTALYNYLFAKKYGGTFVLRIEDTDLERSKPEFEKDIVEGLRWLGIHWNEGPDISGSFGPYRQRERLDTYGAALKKLQDAGHIYQCFCTKEELEKEKEVQILSKQPPRYSGKCSKISNNDAEKLTAEGRGSVIRFRVGSGTIRVTDLVRGELSFDSATLDDFVIAKDLDTPLYNFAVVVDDYLMKISHVIRGEDHISNIPKQILLARALGYDVPQFAHLSMILNADRTKLSKRQNKVSLLEYRAEGYLPEALINFMTLLGWNPGGTQEIFSLDELEKGFDLEHVHKSGAVFDLGKLDWFNSHYIREKNVSELTDLCVPLLERTGLIFADSMGEWLMKSGKKCSRGWLESVVSIEQSRMKKLSDICDSTDYLFEDVLLYEKELLSWKGMSPDEVKVSLTHCKITLEAISEDNYITDALEQVIKKMISESGRKNGSVLWPLRVALTGKSASPSPFEVAALLGKTRTLSRIEAAQKILS